MDPSVWVFEPFQWLWAKATEQPVIAVTLLIAFVACAVMVAQMMGDMHDADA